MNYETGIALANERIENEMFIDYLKDNINELQRIIDEMESERTKNRR